MAKSTIHLIPTAQATAFEVWWRSATDPRRTSADLLTGIATNTAELWLQIENFLFELQDSAQADFVSNPCLVDIKIKIDNGEEHTPSESRRYFAHTIRRVGQWEIVFYWHRDGHIEEPSWREWDQFYSEGIECWLPKEQWAQVRDAYADDFAEHVDGNYK